VKIFGRENPAAAGLKMSAVLRFLARLGLEI
jgi:hypothetical protein